MIEGLKTCPIERRWCDAYVNLNKLNNCGREPVYVNIGKANNSNINKICKPQSLAQVANKIFPYVRIGGFYGRRFLR